MIMKRNHISLVMKRNHIYLVIFGIVIFTLAYFHEMSQNTIIHPSFALVQDGRLQTPLSSVKHTNDVSDLMGNFMYKIHPGHADLDEHEPTAYHSSHNTSSGQETEKHSSLSLNGQSALADRPGEDMQILIWNPFIRPNENHWDLIFKRLTSNQCSENRCTLVYNKTQYEKADAVFFSDSFMNTRFNYQVPPSHPVNQLWVLYGGEANHFMGWKKAQGLQLSRLGMNWTMHFRLDSDVVSPYGAFRPIWNPNDSLRLSDKDMWSTKDANKTVVWMVSNCFANSNRLTYVKELEKHIPVDVYGSCGKLKCGGPHGVTTGNYKMKECNQVIKKYFFYLAFENTFCKDYITEKFFRSFSLDVIPVVMGGADYTLIAPPNSYINFMDFKTPKHLAEYLKQVASDPALYNKYFEWKSSYILDIGYPYTPLVCDLCEKLHQHRSIVPMVPTTLNLSKWFDNDECHNCSWEEVLNNEPRCKLNHK